MFDFLTEPFSYPFMQRALLEILIVGTVCGLVGCFVVLRGLAFIGDALSHTVFPGVVLSYAAGRKYSCYSRARRSREAARHHTPRQHQSSPER